MTSAKELMEFTDDPDEIVARCETLIRAVAPDAPQLYIVLQNQLGADFRRTGTRGFVSHQLDGATELIFGDAWQGPRPTIAIMNRDIARDENGWRDVSIRNSKIMRDIFLVALHEVAHILEREDPNSVLVSPQSKIQSRITKKRIAKLSKQSRQSAIDEIAPPFFLHEWQFIRLAIHLFSRAFFLFDDLFGPLDLREMAFAAGSPYGLSSVDAYQRRLSSELSEMHNAEFEDIKAMRPPEAFCEIWQNDFARWFGFADTEQRKLCSMCNHKFLIPDHTPQVSLAACQHNSRKVTE